MLSYIDGADWLCVCTYFCKFTLQEAVSNWLHVFLLTAVSVWWLSPCCFKYKFWFDGSSSLRIRTSGFGYVIILLCSPRFKEEIHFRWFLFLLFIKKSDKLLDSLRSLTPPVLVKVFNLQIKSISRLQRNANETTSNKGNFL